MRIPLFCSQCAPNEGCNVSYCLVVPREDGRYLATCSNGHQIAATVQMFRFEMLFEIGLHAILDGYNREAVSSFHASYERFHELYFRVVCRSNGVPSKVVEDSWKNIAQQSERQLGAFVTAYMFHECVAPALLDKSKKLKGKEPVKFRNDVIHKGVIPTREEAIWFGQAVFDNIHPILGTLRTKYQKHFFDELIMLLGSIKSEQDSAPLEVHGHSTMLNAGQEIGPPPPTNVEQYLERLTLIRGTLKNC